MFDACRHKLDFTDIHHLACTEVRAANLTHCSFMSAWIQVGGFFVLFTLSSSSFIENLCDNSSSFFYIFVNIIQKGDASPFNIKAQHAECVKRKAAGSVMAVRNVSEQVAMAAVNKVFAKCYSDMEPIGRRVRRKSTDAIRAYNERINYGYE